MAAIRVDCGAYLGLYKRINSIVHPPSRTRVSCGYCIGFAIIYRKLYRSVLLCYKYDWQSLLFFTAFDDFHHQFLIKYLPLSIFLHFLDRHRTVQNELVWLLARIARLYGWLC